MRDTLFERHADVMDTSRIGSIENQAPFHAEATVLLRIAKKLREQGRTLAGRMLEVHVDRDLCGYSCREILPRIGLELGNPAVTFVDTRTGRRRTILNGK